MQELIDYAYEEWQRAEKDADMATEPEEASFHYGEAHSNMMLFIKLMTEADPAFDFQAYCEHAVANDPNFVAVKGEDGRY